jgi:DNA-binding transcriptional regulator YhcF (GntR family)
MRFWLTRNSEVPIREQVVTQITLGILSGDLEPGERLPSLAELARRFKLHQNTISPAYRQLEKEGWLELRSGSGVYVRARKPESISNGVALYRQFTELLALARKLGIPLSEVRERLRQWLAIQPPDHFLVIEPDSELRQIVVAEVQKCVTLGVTDCNFDDDLAKLIVGAVAVVLPSKLRHMKRLLPPGNEVLALKVRSISCSMAPWMPAQADLLIGVASRWQGFLKSARTMLLAAKFPPEALVVRDATKSGWRRGLPQTAAVICDTVTASQLPKGCNAICFRLLSEESEQNLRNYEEFVKGSFTPIVTLRRPPHTT